jgi:hypothetical protein
MNNATTSVRHLTRIGDTEIAAGVVALVVGALFAAEGLLGYFYNYSIFWEGLDHVSEIYGGFALAIVGLITALYVYTQR